MFGKIFQVNPALLEKTYLTAEKAVKSGSDSYNTEKIKKNARSLMSALHSAMNDHSNPFAVSYLKDLQKTMGDYSNREAKIIYSVENAVMQAKRLIGANRGGKDWDFGIVKVMVDIYDLLQTLTYKNFSRKVFQDYMKAGEDSDLGAYSSFYFALVFTMETTAYYFNLWIPEVNSPLSKRTPLEVIQSMTDEHFLFTRTVVLNAVPILAYFQNVDAGKELKKIKDTKALTGVSHEDGGVSALAAGAIAGLIVLGIYTVIAAARWIVYFLKSLRIDIGRGLVEEADILEVNVDRLREQLEVASNPADKERLKKVIAKQEALLEDFRERGKNLLKEERFAASETADSIQREDSLSESSTGKNIEILI